MTIADQIRKALRKHPKSNAAVSKATGIDQCVLSRFVNGKSWPNETSLNALADYLKLKVVKER